MSGKTSEYADDGGDSDVETDPGQLLDEWLGELSNLSGGLDVITSSGQLRPPNVEIATPRIDRYRFSMANLEDSQDVDLDAILGELNVLENQCTIELNNARDSKLIAEAQKLSSTTTTAASQLQHQSRTHNRTSSEGVKMKQQDSGGGTTPSSLPHDNNLIHKSDSVRTESPDNDSAFSDTVSMLSSESSASSGGSGGPKPPQLLQLPDEASRAKAEKIRMAMEKIKEANIQKLFVKVFSMDGCSKSLLVDEKMNCNYVTRLLADKNHVQMDPKWGLVEHLPELYMERVYEDHELLVDNLMLWTRDSKNTIIFGERPDKIQLFMQPERFLLSDSMSIKDARTSISEFDEHSRNMILEEYFSATARNVPEVEGPLYLKADSKKGWKKYHFVLRASGLYYYPKEKAKSSADLICLTTFEKNHVYYGIGWKKKFKAPTDHTFAVKHPHLQESKATKHIRYLCAEDAYTLQRWMVGIRVAKYGRQLLDNYRALLEELAQEDLDKLAHARSCSVSSIAVAASGVGANGGVGGIVGLVSTSGGVGVGGTGGGSNVTTPTQGYSASEGYATQSDSTTYTVSIPPSTSTSSGRHSRASSSSSSGCLSDASVSTPTSANGFDTEFPTGGTIKRKPATMKPSLPLTSITRQLKEVGEGRDGLIGGGGGVGIANVEGGYTSNGTLTRRHSRRKSNGTDDGSNSGTLKRQHSYKTSRGSIESVRSGSSTPVLATTPTGDRASPFGSGNDRPSYDERPPSSASSVRSPTHSVDMPSMTDSILSLPPPPEGTCCHDPSLPPHSPTYHHQGYLPSPPTDIYNSNMSLDSLPPPPNPNELPSMSDEAHLTGSQLSLMSLPPPPASSSAQQHNNHCSSTDTDTIRRRKGSNSGGSSGSNSSCCTPTNDRTPVRSPDASLYGGRLTNGSSTDSLKYNNTAQIYENYPKQPLSNSASFHNTTNGLRSSLRRQIASNSHYSITDMQQSSIRTSPLLHKKVNFQEPTPSSPQRKSGSLKKISFNLPGAEIAPALPKKPSPPKRADSTRLTSPKKLVEPPKDFLKDLQRVMRKKWQVAQKCKEEPQTTPHEVLGFRDPPVLLPDYKETNVSNWVQEHYGPNNFYENVYTNEGILCEDSVTEYATSVNGSPAIIEGNKNSKRPPPPPPKRSETTHLSSQKMSQH